MDGSIASGRKKQTHCCCVVRSAAAALILHVALHSPEAVARPGPIVCIASSCADRFRSGINPGDHFGCAVAGAGRLNADSKDEILIGAWGRDAGGVNSGRAYVYRGPTMATMYAFAVAQAGDRFGWAVAGGVDLNGDGRDDLIISAPYCDQGAHDAGRVYAFSGVNHALLWSRGGQFAGDRFGWTVAAIGDINHDGVNDVIVGAPFNNVAGADAGRAYVLSGANGSTLWRLTGETAGDQFGAAVTGVADLNDDGFDDFAVGAPLSNSTGVDTGRVYIYSGRDKSILQIIDGKGTGVHFGAALAERKFNFNGDAVSFLLVGIPFDSQNGYHAGHFHGYVRNHDHPNCGEFMCEYLLAYGDAAGDRYGAAVALGQLAGNAIPDFVIGAPLSNANGHDSGAVYVLSVDDVPISCCTTPTTVRIIAGDAPGDQFGASVAVADMNGDGREDLIVGAPNNDAIAPNAGRVYVFLTQP